MGMGSGKGKAPVKSVGKEKTAVKAKDKAVGKAAAMQQRMEAMSAAKSKKQGAAASKPAGGMAGKDAGPTQSDRAAKVKAMAAKAAAGKKPVGQMSKGLSDLMSGTKAKAMKSGGSCKKYARGGGIEVRGKTKGRII